MFEKLIKAISDFNTKEQNSCLLIDERIISLTSTESTALHKTLRVKISIFLKSDPNSVYNTLKPKLKAEIPMLLSRDLQYLLHIESPQDSTESANRAAKATIEEWCTTQIPCPITFITESEIESVEKRTSLHA